MPEQMLVDLFSNIKEDSQNKIFYKGIVTDNRDPMQLGQIKCKIEGLFESENPAQLPWVAPFRPSSFGGRSDLGGFAVPEVHSTVAVFFPFGDFRAPYYFGDWIDNSSNSPSILFGEDYPNIYGFVDSTIQWLKINKVENYIEFFRQLKDLITLDRDGNLQVNLRGKVTLNLGSDVQLKINGNVVTHITGNINEVIDGSITKSESGSMLSQISGDKIIQTYNGDCEIRFNGYKAERINGDTYSQHVAGYTDYSKPEGGRSSAQCGDICTDSPSPDISDLNSAITILNTKLDQLKSLADDVEKLRDNIKTQLASQGVILTGSDV